MLPENTDTKLLEDVHQLIQAARQRAAAAVNQELSGLYWQVGRRIHLDVLQGQRAEYGKQVLKALSLQLSLAYGKGWSEQQLRHCLRAAETFPDEAMFSALRRELTWTHIKTLLPAKRYCKTSCISRLNWRGSGLPTLGWRIAKPICRAMKGRRNVS